MQGPVADTLVDEHTDDSLAAGAEPAAPLLVEEELLVEEISIDGMCGVY